MIVGIGGQAKVVLDCAISTNMYNQISFLTNDLTSSKISEYPLIYEQDISIDYILKYYDEIVVAIGNNNIRLNKSNYYLDCGIKLATLIHPRAVVSNFSQIEEGTVVFANAVINPFSKIGKACIINTGAIVEHDCILGDGVHVSPTATMGGTVSIGEKTWVCINSAIKNNLKIGKNSIIGAGAVVLHDVPDNVLVAGVPASIKKYYNDQQ